MNRFWGLSLRARLMIIGVAGVTVALGLGSLLLFRVLVFAVDRTLDNEALTTAHEVAAMVDEARLPTPIPVSGAQVIQVVDNRGRVVGGSLSADRLIPLLRPDELRRALSGSAVIVSGSRIGLAGPLRTEAVAAGPLANRDSVIVAVQIGDVLASRAAFRNSLLISIPVLIVALAAIAWRVIGWTLRPVEALRRDAERISGRVRDERLAVPRAADEIRALAITLNGMLDRLAAARGRQQSFVADAAHELRSPLTSIRTQLEVAAHLGESGDLPAELMVDVTRLSALIEDLLLLARADADSRRPANPSLFDARSLLLEVAADYDTARVPVVVVPGVMAAVAADRGELRRAIGNLVDNAVRHAESEVRLCLEVEGLDIVISVIDDGPGIAPTDRERVFDRFTRLDDARDRDAGGSGLGLAIVRELVTRAGGTVGFAGSADLHATGAGAGLRAEIRLSRPHLVGSPSEPASQAAEQLTE